MRSSGWRDAERMFAIYDPATMTPRQQAFGTVVGVDAFAVVGNDAPGQTISAQIEFDIDDNGGYLAIKAGDIVSDPQTGVSLTVIRIDGARGKYIVSLSQQAPIGTQPAALPPTS